MLELGSKGRERWLRKDQGYGKLHEESKESPWESS